MRGIARAFGNRIGNYVATIVVTAWEDDIDRAQAHRVLSGEQTADTAVLLDTPAAVPQTA
ncbi:hypothetical protein [Methylobacterium sp. GC_Met_2]|uniref:hypothetical protein n=1 Tax=Methylobacterium sp. GC_Met_2 TaxID=2937376 RepID=UPI0031F7CA10